MDIAFIIKIIYMIYMIYHYIAENEVLLNKIYYSTTRNLVIFSYNISYHKNSKAIHFINIFIICKLFSLWTYLHYKICYEIFLYTLVSRWLCMFTATSRKFEN